MSQGEAIEGSAGHYDHFVIVEVALPWERDVWSSRHGLKGVNDVLQEATKRGVRVRGQAIAPDAPAKDDTRTVIHYTHQDSSQATYDRQEYRIHKDLVASLVGRILGLGCDFDAAQYAVQSHVTRELLVCTHGSRDVCCAKQGFPLYEALQKRADAAKDPSVAVWRTSHLGGHRFAPTLLDFPRGILWGRVTDEIAPSLLNETASKEALSSIYRGWSALPPMAQLAEHKLVLTHGWSWLNEERRASVSGEAPEWQVNFETPKSPTGSKLHSVFVKQSGTVRTMTNTGAQELKEFPTYTAKLL